MNNQMNFFDLANHYAKLSSQRIFLERLLKEMDFITSIKFTSIWMSNIISFLYLANSENKI